VKEVGSGAGGRDEPEDEETGSGTEKGPETSGGQRNASGEKGERVDSPSDRKDGRLLSDLDNVLKDILIL